jgi:hypothetical protein
MARHPKLKSFYDSAAWRNFRLQLINERHNKCEKCNRYIPHSKDIIGHHKVELTPENVKDHSISLNPDLIEIICFECHNKEHKRFGFNMKKTKAVYLVYGPPLSGKTSFVKEHMSRGDLIVDIDKLYEAVTLLPCYDKPDALFRNVIGIHNQLIDNIKTRYGKWNNAWIIGGYADKYKRDRLANETGAEVIFMNLPKEECLKRLEQDTDRRDWKAEWKQYIEKWFEEYTK